MVVRGDSMREFIDNDTTINHYNATAAAAAATATLIAVTPPRTWDTRGVFRKKQRIPKTPSQLFDSLILSLPLPCVYSIFFIQNDLKKPCYFFVFLEISKMRNRIEINL